MSHTNSVLSNYLNPPNGSFKTKFRNDIYVSCFVTLWRGRPTSNTLTSLQYHEGLSKICQRTKTQQY